jgi:hypothetical protein
MLDDRNARTGKPICISRVARVVERIGLAMSGTMCGTFVAAYLARAGIGTLDSIGFITSMILVGMVGFYLGIDIPEKGATQMKLALKGPALKVDPVELLSATGTFLAAIAALVSVYAIVFDEVPQRMGEFVVGGWWLLGVIMQIGAGAIGRLRLVNKTAG